MPLTASRSPELAIPVASLRALRHALVTTVGADAAAQALRHAGFAAGEALFPVLAAGPDEELQRLPARRFWARLSRLFSARGWGQLSYAQHHEAVGELSSPNWVEAAAEDGASQPSCHFTTGALANLLGRAAGTEVAVLEVECRTRGDSRCRFLFGGAQAVYALYDRLNAGDAPDEALRRLG
jgi:bacteriochlorophyll 4-vinyl reductase